MATSKKKRGEREIKGGREWPGRMCIGSGQAVNILARSVAPCPAYGQRGTVQRGRLAPDQAVVCTSSMPYDFHLMVRQFLVFWVTVASNVEGTEGIIL